MSILEKVKKATSLLIITSMMFMPISGYALEKGVIIGNGVNLRDNADIKSNIIGNTSLGQSVDIVESNNEWYKVESGNGTGWINRDYVVIKSSSGKMGVTTSKVNFRKSPSLDGESLKLIPQNANVNVLSEENQWSKVKYDNLTGWVYSKYISYSLNSPKGFIKGKNVNIRKSADLKSDIIAKVTAEEISIKGYKDSWYNVVTKSNKDGWVHKQFVDVMGKTVTSRGVNSKKAMSVVALAKAQLGKRYVWGSTGPNTFDCSGYTSYVFKKFGIKLPRTSRTQGTAGVHVKKSELAPGDLVFFDTSGANNGVITHVGIYIGDNKFIHCSSGKSAKKVVITDINKAFYTRGYVTARRVL